MYDGISISDPKFSVAIVFSDPDLLKKYFNLGDFTTYRAVYSRCTCAETAASEHFTWKFWFYVWRLGSFCPIFYGNREIFRRYAAISH